MNYDFVAFSKPVDRTAGMVSRGYDEGWDYTYEQNSSSHIESDTFLPFIAEGCNHTGVKRGSLTVLGWYAERPSRLVAKCDCGKYVVRKVKSINNSRNSQDSCNECRRLDYLLSRGKRYHYIDNNLLDDSIN